MTSKDPERTEVGTCESSSISGKRVIDSWLRTVTTGYATHARRVVGIIWTGDEKRARIERPSTEHSASFVHGFTLPFLGRSFDVIFSWSF
jgi:hypothetical protein